MPGKDEERNEEAQMVRLDLYIVHWNAPEWCSNSVSAVLQSQGIDVRCTVIDNASQSLPDLPSDVRVVRLRENAGYAGGANRGLALAEDDPAIPYVGIAAHDALPTPACLRQLVEALDLDPSLGVVGPLIRKPSRSAGGSWRGWRATTIPEPPADATGPVERDWVSGLLLVGRRECFLGIGGFDARFGSYVEDVDFCLRARDHGWRVALVPQARADGQGSRLSSLTVAVDVNSAYLAVKRGGLRSLWPILARYVVWIPRGLVAAVVSGGRSGTRRRQSLVHAWHHALAVAQLLTSPTQLKDFASQPAEERVGQAPCRPGQ